MASSSEAAAVITDDAAPSRGSWRSQDPAEAQHILSTVYAPHKLTVGRDAGFGFEFELINSSRLTVGFSTFRTEVTIDVPPPGTFYCLCLALRGTVLTNSGTRAVAVSETTSAVLNPDEAWRFAECNDTLISARVDRADLEDDLSALLGRRIEQQLVFDEPLDLSNESGGEFWHILRTLQSAAGASSRLAQAPPMVADRLGALLRSTMLVAFHHNHSELLTSDDAARTRVPQAIRRVIDAVEHDPLQVRAAADAARIAHLSLRALESGFERYVGMSPTAYVRRVRLARAREDLLGADPENDTVLAIARRWGFGHAGRFAASYKQRYGESPSQSLYRRT